MSHMWMSHTWMSHVTHINAPARATQRTWWPSTQKSTTSQNSWKTPAKPAETAQLAVQKTTQRPVFFIHECYIHQTQMTILFCTRQILAEKKKLAQSHSAWCLCLLSNLIEAAQAETYIYVVFCSVLQYVAVFCRVLQGVAGYCSVLQCLAIFYSVLQCIVACCHVMSCVVVCCYVLLCVGVCCSVLQCVTVCCSVLQCAAMFCRGVCRVLQGTAVCCSV